MSWSLLRSPLPTRAWTVVSPDGRMILNPVDSRETAERMAGQNVRGSVGKARDLGYRIIQVDICEVAA